MGVAVAVAGCADAEAEADAEVAVGSVGASGAAGAEFEGEGGSGERTDAMGVRSADVVVVSPGPVNGVAGAALLPPASSFDRSARRRRSCSFSSCST